MKVLVTGATGYIGRRVVKSLVEDISDVEVLTLNRDVSKAESLLPYDQCKHISTDDMDDAVKSFAPEVCIHLATLSSSRNDKDIIEPMLDANIGFGVNLLNALKEAGSLKLFVNTGSFAEYRNGVDMGFSDAYLYTATKSAFRHFVDYYASLCGFKYLTAVPFTVYGGKDTAKKLMDYMIESIDAVDPVKMSPGEQVLDFIHVDDVVNFFVKVVLSISKIQDLPQGSTYFLGTGIGTKVKDLAKMIGTQLGKTLNIEWGGLDYRPLDVMYAVAPISKNTPLIDWSAKITLNQGIKQRIIEIRK